MKKRMWMRGAALAAMCASLSGCLTFGSIGDRGTALDEGVGGWQNRGILLNIVRASRAEPLYFMSLNQAIGSATTGLNIGYPTFWLGPHLPLADKQYSLGGGGTNSLQNSTMTQFTANVFSNQAFYQGITQPLTLNEVYMLVNQGFPRELIFYMLIDKARLTPVNGGDSFFIYNNPANSLEYAKFKIAIKEAMEAGLVTQMPSTDHSTHEDTTATPNPNVTPPPPSAAPDTMASAISSLADALSQQQHHNPPTQEPLLCFEKSLANSNGLLLFKQQADAGITQPGFCGQVTPHQQLTVLLLGQEYKVEIYLRSVSGIFRYLGFAMTHPEVQPQLTDYNAALAAEPASARPAGVPYVVPPEVTPEGPMLTVQSGGGISGLGCFAHVYYADRPWCVPEHGPQLTREVFNVLTILVALKQSPGDLPQSSTVLLGG